MCYLYQCNPLRNFKSGFITWRKCAWNNFFWINGAKIWYRVSRFINAHANIASWYAIFHYCWYLLKQPVVPSRHFLLPRFSSTRFAATSSLLSSKSSLIKINHIYTNIRLESIQITYTINGILVCDTFPSCGPKDYYTKKRTWFIKINNINLT